jgi:hypothetical protein
MMEPVLATAAASCRGRVISKAFGISAAGTGRHHGRGDHGLRIALGEAQKHFGVTPDL